jgi:single-strand DNA-binding protein
MSSNTVTLVGNLTRDPELRYTPSGAAVAKFGIAVNRFYTSRQGEKVEQTDFFNVNAWRTLGENIAESLKTGSRVVVTGRIQSRSWETDDGQRRTVIEIEADEVGPSLRWATAAVTKTTRASSDDWQSQGDSKEDSAPSTTEGGSEQEVSTGA